MNGRASGPLLALAAAACLVAFTAGHPAVLAALLAGALVLHATGHGGPGRLLLTGAAISALGLVVLTPLVSAQGDLVLFAGPDIPLLDTEVTAEELVAGLISGMRLAAVMLLVAGVLAHVDADRLQGLAARLAPRSALVVALAARLVPTLERDARSLSELARLRGVPITQGSRRTRATHAARLMVPLVGSSLERSMDVAAAMAARGYGSGRPTRLPAPPSTAAERIVWGCAAAAAALAAWIVATGAARYTVYPVLGTLLTPAPLIAAAGLLAALGVAAAVLRR